MNIKSVLKDENNVSQYDWGVTGLWFSNNYGAILTTYALCIYIERLGFSVMLVRPPKGTFSKSWENEASEAFRFISRYFVIGPTSESTAQMLKYNELCKGFVTGSDLLWAKDNFSSLNRLLYVFSGYAFSDKPKVAYSTSIGTHISEKGDPISSMVKPAVGSYKAISLRESMSVSSFNGAFGCTAKHTIDPVFLLDKDDYLWLARYRSEKTHRQHYIMSYLLQNNEKQREIISLAEERLHSFCYSITDLFVQKDEVVQVEDWLAALAEADYVITDSFHGVCFALIFGKPFIALWPRGYEDRIISLLRDVGLEERLIREVDGERANRLMEEQIDWNKVNGRLDEIIKDSKLYLDNAIKERTSIARDIKSDELLVDLCLLAGEQEDTQRKILATERNIKRELSVLKAHYKTIQTRIYKQWFIDNCTAKRVALKGAGYHTKEILKILQGRISFVCILDRAPVQEDLFGIPVVTDPEAERFKPDIIVISSYKYRAEMKADLMKYYLMADIRDPYEELERDGYLFFCEFYGTTTEDDECGL